MDTKKLRKEANIALKKLVDALGLPGDEYIKDTSHYILINRKQEEGIMGKTYGVESNELENLLEKQNWDKEQKFNVFHNGLITIKVGKGINDNQILVTCIHELIHAHREILTDYQNRIGDVPNVIEYNGRTIKLNPSDRTLAVGNYLDAAQDLFVGSTDDSGKAQEEASHLEEDDLKWYDSRESEQFSRQQAIDETLVEVMAMVAFHLYRGKIKDIPRALDHIQEISEINENEDFASLINIIKRHKDLDLFKWMIDPLTYQQGAVNYDFFKNYITDKDIPDVERIVSFYSDQTDKIIDKQVQASRSKK